MAISNQCRAAFPYCRAASAFSLARCRRIRHLNSSGGSSSGGTPSAVVGAPVPASYLFGRREEEAGEPASAASPAAAAGGGALSEVASLLTEAVELLGREGPYDHAMLRACYAELGYVFGVRGGAGTLRLSALCMSLAADVAAQRALLEVPQARDGPLTLQAPPVGAAAGTGGGACGLARDVDAAAGDVSVLVAADAAEAQRRGQGAQARYLAGQAEEAAAAAGGGGVPDVGRVVLGSYARWARALQSELGWAAVEDASVEAKLTEWRQLLQSMYAAGGTGGGGAAAAKGGDAAAAAAAATAGEVVFRAGSPALHASQMLSAELQKQAAGEGLVLLAQLYEVVPAPMRPRPAALGEPSTGLPPVPGLHWFVYCRRRREGASGDADGGAAPPPTHLAACEVVVHREDVQEMQRVCRALAATVGQVAERLDELQALGEDGCLGGGGGGDAKGKPAAGAAKGGDKKGGGGTPGDDEAVASSPPDVLEMEARFDALLVEFAEGLRRMVREAAAGGGEVGGGGDDDDCAAAFLPPLSLTDREVLGRTHATALLLADLFDPEVGVSEVVQSAGAGAATPAASGPFAAEVAAWLSALLLP